MKVSLFCSKCFILSSEIKLNLFWISPLMESMGTDHSADCLRSVATDRIAIQSHRCALGCPFISFLYVATTRRLYIFFDELYGIIQHPYTRWYVGNGASRRNGVPRPLIVPPRDLHASLLQRMRVEYTVIAQNIQVSRGDERLRKTSKVFAEERSHSEVERVVFDRGPKRSVTVVEMLLRFVGNLGSGGRQFSLW